MPGSSTTDVNNAGSVAFAAVKSSNTTSNYFLGGPQRPWMTDTTFAGPRPPRPIPQRDPSAGSQLQATPTEPAPGPTSEPARPPSIAFNASIPAPTNEAPRLNPSIGQEGCHPPGEETRSVNERQDSAGPEDVNVGDPQGTQELISTAHDAPVEVSTLAQRPLSSPGEALTAQPPSQNGTSPAETPTPNPGPPPGGNSSPANVAMYLSPNTLLLGSRKRPNDASHALERRMPAMSTSYGLTNLPTQLPTPQDSPVTSNTTTLSEKVEAALSRLPNRPRTVDMQPVIDDSRVEMLRDACRQNDSFYLMAHSLFCSWSSGQCAILEKFQLTATHFDGLTILQTVLGSNRQLTLEMFQVLLNFPSPPSTLVADRSSLTSSLIEDVKSFLHHLAINFAAMKNNYALRGWPPSPAEFQYRLQLPSKVLQKSLFLSVLRERYRDHHLFLGRALLLFERELEDPTYNSLTLKEVNVRQGIPVPAMANAFAQKYRQLESQHFTGTLQLNAQNPALAPSLQASQQAAHGQNPPVQQFNQPVSQNPHPMFIDRTFLRAHVNQQSSPGVSQNTNNGQIPVGSQVNRPLPPSSHQFVNGQTQLGGQVRQEQQFQQASPPPILPSSDPGVYPPSMVASGPPVQQLSQMAPNPAYGQVGQPQARPCSVTPQTGRRPSSQPRFYQQQPLPGQGSLLPSQLLQTDRSHQQIMHAQSTSSPRPLPQVVTSQSVPMAARPQPLVMSPIWQSPRLLQPSNDQNVTLQPRPLVNAQDHAHSTQGQFWFPRDHRYTLPLVVPPDPDRRALHQAHLRSPEYQKIDSVDGNASNVKYYQLVEDIIELPQLLDVDTGLIRWNVHISHSLWSRKAEGVPSETFMSKRRNVSSGSTLFRLKSIALKAQGEPPKLTLSDFCVQPTKWPSCLSVAINGDMGVDFRRKAHWGMDLPTDVTDLLHEGDNEVVMGSLFTPKEAQTAYFMAIEIICVANHEKLMSMPSRIGAREVLSSIAARLKNTCDSNDDDDLIISQPFVSIDLVDPFMSVIWVTPVRGRDCQHHECFDLEAFLHSRTGRFKHSGLTDADQWKCPICKKDARPSMLLIDEFLLDVRKTLEKNNQLDARAILVKEDGTWEPKMDAKDRNREDRDTQTPDTAQKSMAPHSMEATTTAHTRTSIPPSEPDVVIIPDDDD